MVRTILVLLAAVALSGTAGFTFGAAPKPTARMAPAMRAERVRAAGIDGFRLLAENIGTTTMPGDRVTALIEGWMDSPIHRENILNPAFNTTGIAVVETSDGRTIAVQLFATY